MKNIFRMTVLTAVACAALMFFPSCSEEKWDINEQGIPQFVDDNFIDVTAISQISRFRSAEGHDYSDSYEQCRSMKHYFQPYWDIDWTTIKIYSPVTGTVKKLYEEWAGTQIHIVSDDYPAFRFIIFHVNVNDDLEVGDKVVAGQLIGKHASTETMSDIAVEVSETYTKRRLISYFETLTDHAFLPYSERGVSVRSDFIITQQERDSYPLSCNGETFATNVNNNAFENWVILETP